MADSLATPAELATFLQKATQDEINAGNPDVLDTGVALQALASASGAVRAVCGWSVSQETVTETLVGDGWVFLPTLYLTALSATVGGTPLASGTDLVWYRNGTVRLLWHRSGTPVTLTYTHGFSPVPDEVRAVVLELAAQTVENPLQMASSTVGGVVDVFSRSSGSDDLAADPRLAPYRLPTVA